MHLYNLILKNFLFVKNFWHEDDEDAPIVMALPNLSICINLDLFSNESDSEKIKITREITIIFHELACTHEN